MHHELVHALTANSFQVRDEEPEWLWEGLAEYLALVYTGLDGEAADPDWFRARIQQRTNDCTRSLEEEGVGNSLPPADTVVTDRNSPIGAERERDRSIVRVPHVSMGLNLQMKVRHCRVAGISDSGQHVACLD